jgi:hypothetical protein
MGSFKGLLSLEDVEAIHSYLIDQAWQSYEKSQLERNSDSQAPPHTPQQ